MTVRVLDGDCRAVLAGLPAQSVQTCVTSPPYFGLRDYGVVGQLGLEPTPDEYVAAMVDVFRAVRRVLRDDGTLWLNLGDSYAGGGRGGNIGFDERCPGNGARIKPPTPSTFPKSFVPAGLKPKDLIGIPWRVAFALQADGWYLRSDIVWAKPNPMPESVTDRPTKSHEYVFLLSKQERYFYDAEAVAEPVTESSVLRLSQDVESQEGSHRVPGKTNGAMKAVIRKSGDYGNGAGRNDGDRHPSGGWAAGATRNARSVWSITTQPFSGAHFATMPPELVRRCVAAGSRRGDTVLDPFGGAGTTGLVADRLGRDAVLIELNPEYAAMARHRIHSDAPLFTDVA